MKISFKRYASFASIFMMALAIFLGGCIDEKQSVMQQLDDAIKIADSDSTIELVTRAKLSTMERARLKEIFTTLHAFSEKWKRELSDGSIAREDWPEFVTDYNGLVTVYQDASQLIKLHWLEYMPEDHARFRLIEREAGLLHEAFTREYLGKDLEKALAHARQFAYATLQKVIGI